MGIAAVCPNGHRIKVKDSLAGRKGICPKCGASFRIPTRATGTAQSPTAAAGAGLPTARIVSIDPRVAASLPVAFAAGESPGDGAAAPRRERMVPQSDAPPDFTPVADDAVAAPPAARAFGAHATLGERPDLAWCVAVRGGAPSAPLDAAAMHAWLDSGAATVDHVVWRTDWPDWRPLGDVFPGALPSQSPGWP